MNRLDISAAFVILLAVGLVTGCGEPGTNGGGTGSDPHKSADDHDGHDHDSEHEGPHGGHVIELGRNHEYHAEVVEDENASSVTVYILDKDLKELAISEPSIAMNLVVDGKARTFELSAKYGADGKSSCFVSRGAEVFEALHKHEASGKLRVTINGSPHIGQVEHHHHHDKDLP